MQRDFIIRDFVRAVEISKYPACGLTRNFEATFPLQLVRIVQVTHSESSLMHLRLLVAIDLGIYRRRR